MIKLIAALGNPGLEYKKSRHNVSWQFIEYFSFFDDLNWQKKFSGSFSETIINGNKIFIVLPLTFMNRSGVCVSAVAGFFKIAPEEILIIHDDLELKFGISAFKFGGGLGGHNGLRSVTSSLGTKNFNRFRIGISRPDHSDITSYVLGNFAKAEQTDLPFILDENARLLESELENDFKELEKQYGKISVLNITD